MNLTTTTINDRERIAEALRFFAFGEHVEFAALSTDEHAEFLRLLAEYETPAPQLPSAKGLHAHVREGQVPEVFTQMRERLDILGAAREVETDVMHQLMREAHAQGVAAAVLARWAGYTRRWTTRILAA